MRTVIIKKYDCNTCGRKGCRGDVIRDGKGGVRKWIECPGWTKQSEWRMPLLWLAAEHSETPNKNSQAFGHVLYEILDQTDLKFDEIPRYPYFRFLFRESDQEYINNDIFFSNV